MSPQFMYGILVVLILLLAAYILHQDKDMASTKLFVFGLFLYGGGFLLWNFGNYQYCTVSRVFSQGFEISIPYLLYL
jgi:hypothetical protein